MQAESASGWPGAGQLRVEVRNVRSKGVVSTGRRNTLS